MPRHVVHLRMTGLAFLRGQMPVLVPLIVAGGAGGAGIAARPLLSASADRTTSRAYYACFFVTVVCHPR
jgi:hypothetical protein